MCRIDARPWLVLLWLLLSAPAWAQTRVSILPGDAVLRQALETVSALQAEHPSLRETDIRVYSSTRARQQDLEHLRNSDLIILQMVGRAQFSSLEQELRQALERGARIYAYGGSTNADDLALGIRQDETLARYFTEGGATNLRNGVLHGLSLVGYTLPVAPPEDVPETGIYDAGSGRWFVDHAAFLAQYSQHRPGRPWVGFVVYQSNIVAGSTAHIDAVIAALEARDLNVLTVFGYPAEAPIEAFLLDEAGNSRVEVVIAASIKIGVKPEVLTPLLQRLDVPVINAISLFSLSREQWEASPVGMDIQERAWQLAMPEMAGLIQPTVFAAKATVRDAQSGQEFVEEQPIPERVEMLARRAARWIALRETPNAQKRVFLQYFNFPPGREAVGAAYLNVLPESLDRVMDRLEQEGYQLDGRPDSAEALQQDILQYGVNLAADARSDVDALARSGEAVLLPVATYAEWFRELPASSQALVTASWGAPEDNEIMAWRDDEGRPHFVLPVRRYGNILVGPQPSRGKTDDPEKLYHDMMFPPTHQYIAFYLWLHKEFQADAMFQFGTHGTHEWLPGREAGLAFEDAPEYLIQDLPNLYAFIMDNAGEATIAMRRGMATMISHLTPPFDRLGLNPELRELEERIGDYNRALQQSPALAAGHLQNIQTLAGEMGILMDLDMAEVAAEADTSGDATQGNPAALVDALHHYLEEISDRITPYGMHTFGEAMSAEEIEATADAILSLDTTSDSATLAARRTQLGTDLLRSAGLELDALVAGLAGRYVPAGVGGDPLRNPGALPTGRNFYSFDPRRLPSASTYALGQRMAESLIEDYRARHGEYPQKLSFTLWGVETMRTEGVQESQIMHLLGVRPVHDAAGVVRGIEAIPRETLGRPRIDVTVIPSGLHRDLFSNVLALLDQAASIAQAQDEADNVVRRNTLATQALLQEQGVEADLAARMAAVRLFTVPPGAYGTNMESAIERSDAWEDEQTLAQMYMSRMGHLYGQGFWGESGTGTGATPALGQTLLRNALAGTQMTVHARSSNVFGVLDGDDPFASFGGLSLAVRAIDGTTPEVMISNLANPAEGRQETLERYMGRELRSRYLNPEWITAMQAEGYAGAKFMNDVVQNLWGWQVTVPEAVDAAKWNEMYQTYVADRHALGMEEFFREAGNLQALQELMARMLEAVRKGYWTPDQAVIDDLGQRVGDLATELQMVCEAGQCEDPLLQTLVAANLVPAPALPVAALAAGASQATAPAEAAAPQAENPSSASTQAPQPVQGFAMEVSTLNNDMQEAPRAVAPWENLLSLLLLLVSAVLGFLRRTRDENTQHTPPRGLASSRHSP